MNMQSVTIARIYTMDGHDQLNEALYILRDERKIAGVIIIRGIVGFGESREVHTPSLLTRSLELPLLLDFYDEPETVITAIQVLKSRMNIKHIVSWSAQACLDEPV